MLQDILHALRLFRKNPGFTLIAALSLALGIGTNSAIFSVADALLLRPLGVRQPNEIVTVSANTPGNPYERISFPDYRDIREKNTSFDGVVAYEIGMFALTVDPKALPQMRAGMEVSDNFFRVLGVEPLLGRALLPTEGVKPGMDPVVVLGYDFWTSEFAQDRAVVGREIRLNGIPFTIVGVAPQKFTGMDQYFRPAFYLPLSMTARLLGPKQDLYEARDHHWLAVKARLKPGVSLASAKAEMAGLAAQLTAAYPATNQGRKLTVLTEIETRYQQSPADAILVVTLMGLVGLVLLIACANVANLLLARATVRSREIAVRLAIGVSKWRLLRQLLTESLMLSLLGAALGMGFAYGGIVFLQGIRVPTDMPIVIAPKLDLRVIWFSLGAALVSAFAFGLTPALQAANTDLVTALKSADARSGSRNRTVGRNLLVIGQVALAMALLIATGMMIDGFGRMLVLDPGFRIDHLLTMEIDPGMNRYTPEQARSFFRSLRDRARALPGVENVALTRSVPLTPNQSIETVIPEGFQFPKGQERESLFASVVDEHYFDTMRIRITSGRGFSAVDKEGSRRVAVVNQEFAKRYYPNQDPIGKRFRMNGKNGPWVEIVGTTGTGKYVFSAEPPTPFFYLPYEQNPRTRLVMVVQTTDDPAAMAPSLREAVRGLDPNQPVYNVRSIDSFYQTRAIAVPKMIMQVITTMGLLGLTLALIGLYGLISFSVGRRTREIGIRMAIGAGHTQVLGMVLRQGLLLAGSGILIGSALSYGVVQVIKAALAGLGTPNPATYVIVPVVLLITTLAACYLPARRASRVDPLRALRYE